MAGCARSLQKKRLLRAIPKVGFPQSQPSGVLKMTCGGTGSERGRTRQAAGCAVGSDIASPMPGETPKKQSGEVLTSVDGASWRALRYESGGGHRSQVEAIATCETMRLWRLFSVYGAPCASYVGSADVAPQPFNVTHPWRPPCLYTFMAWRSQTVLSYLEDDG